MRTIVLAAALAIVMLMGVSVFAQSAAPAPDRGSEGAGPPAKALVAEKTPRPPKPPDGQPGETQGKHVRRPAGFGEHSPAMFRDATEEEVNDILAFTREYMPQINADLLKMKETDPAQFRQMCRRLRFEIRQLRALKTENPEAFQKALEEKQLQARVRELAQAFRKSSDPAERDRLRQELRGRLQKLFEAEAFTKRAQIRRLEEALKKLRDELQNRETRRDDFIDKQLNDLTSPRADVEPSEQPGTPKVEGKREGKS